MVESADAFSAIANAESAFRAPLVARSSRRWYVTVGLPLLLGLVTVFLFSGAFDFPGAAMDEGAVLVYPELISKGAVPYRDFETYYAPANSYVLAAVYAFTGPNVMAERAVGLIYRLLVLLAIFVIGTRWSRIVAVAAVMLAGMILLGGGVGAGAWMGGAVCSFWSLWLTARSDSSKLAFTAGLLWSGALLFRADFGPAMLASATPLVLALDPKRRLRWVSGVALGLLPLVVLAVIAGPRAVADNLFFLPVVVTNGGRRLPFSTADAQVLTFFFAHVFACVINLFAGVLAWRRSGGSGAARLFTGLSLFALGLTHQALQRMDIMHVMMVAFASLALLPIAIFIIATQFMRPSRAVAAAAAAFAVVLAETAMPELTATLRERTVGSLSNSIGESWPVEHQGRTFALGNRPLARATADLLTRLESMSHPGERLFVGPADLRRTSYTDTFLYYLCPDLTPATHFLEMNPGSPNRPNSRLAADVATADWLILNRLWDKWDEPNSSRNYGPDAANEVVRARFEVCGEFGPYLLFRRKEARPNRDAL